MNWKFHHTKWMKLLSRESGPRLSMNGCVCCLQEIVEYTLQTWRFWKRSQCDRTTLKSQAMYQWPLLSRYSWSQWQLELVPGKWLIIHRSKHRSTMMRTRMLSHSSLSCWYWYSAWSSYFIHSLIMTTMTHTGVDVVDVEMLKKVLSSSRSGSGCICLKYVLWFHSKW